MKTNNIARAADCGLS